MVDTSSGTRQPAPATLGAYVQMQREHLGWSQRQLAARVGVHHSSIARLERDEVDSHNMRPGYLQGLADALGEDIGKLLPYIGVTPLPELPSVRLYFRRKLGVNADEAEVLAHLVAQYQKRNKGNQ